jgi:hypothetical protein
VGIRNSMSTFETSILEAPLLELQKKKPRVGA